MKDCLENEYDLFVQSVQKIKKVKKNMKKYLKIFGIIVIVIILAMIILPVAFKGKIIQLAKVQANAHLNAVVEFDEHVKLSLIKSFPQFYLELDELIVANKTPFEGDTLANIGSLAVKLNLVEVLKGKLEVKAFYLDKAFIYLHVLNDTVNYTANWDILFPSEPSDEDEIQTEEDVVSLPVKDIKVSNSYFIYEDELYEIFLDLKDLSLEGQGDFSEEIFDLATKVHARETDFVFEGVKYLSKVNTDLDAIFGLDFTTWTYTFKENLLKLNDFELRFDGFFTMPESDIDMDFTFEAPSTDFKNLVSLLPVIYSKDFEKLTAEGEVNFNGQVKGIYGAESSPAFDVNLGVNKGRFKYPDLPTAVNNVFIDLHIDNPDGIADHTVINMKSIHFEMDKEPFDASILLKTPESDPYMDASIHGKIDLSQIKDLVKLEEKTQLQGIVNTDLKLRGHLSSIENENYDKFYASGNIIFAALKYYSDEFNKMLEVPQLHLEFSPAYVDLKEMYLLVDNSDLQARGRLTNFIPYFFDKGVLVGKLNLNSNYLNLNTLLQNDNINTASDNTAESSSELSAYILPENMDFSMDAKFNKLIYDQMDLDDVFCKLKLKDSKLNIENLRANMLEGEIVANGFYETSNPEEPGMKFILSIKELNIKKTHNSFLAVQKFAPIAQFINGGVGGELRIESKLDENMKPHWESLFSKGKLIINKMALQEFVPVTMLANTLQMDKYKHLEVKNIRPSYKIENGKFFLDSTDFKVDKTKFNVRGWNSLDKSMEYTLKLDIPAEEFKTKSTTVLSQVGLSNAKLPLGETIPMNAYVTGTIDKPKVKITPLDAKSTVKEVVREKAKEEIDKQKEILEQKAQEELDKQKEILEEKAKQEADRLKQEAEKKRKEVEQKAREAAEKKKKELEEEAKKKLKGIFK